MFVNAKSTRCRQQLVETTLLILQINWGFKMQRLMAISVFWRNDQKHGIGFTFDDSFGNLDEMFEVITETYKEMWRESVINSDTTVLVRDLLLQLEGISQADKSQPLEIDRGLLVLGNVWLLQTYGYLKQDEFNGLLLAYVE